MLVGTNNSLVLALESEALPKAIYELQPIFKENSLIIPMVSLYSLKLFLKKLTHDCNVKFFKSFLQWLSNDTSRRLHVPIAYYMELKKAFDFHFLKLMLQENKKKI